MNKKQKINDQSWYTEERAAETKKILLSLGKPKDIFKDDGTPINKMVDITIRGYLEDRTRYVKPSQRIIFDK